MYTAQGAPDKEQLVQQYSQLVKRLAYQLMAKLPASVQVEDLVQNGMIGLLDAIGRFEEGLGAQFETYAVQRIRGAMLDGLRENDWVPRGVRPPMRRLVEYHQPQQQRQSRAPSEGELAEALAMPLADYQRLLLDARGHQLLYLEDLAGEQEDDFLEHNLPGATPDPLAILEDEEMRRLLVHSVDALPEREKMVMALYYDEDLNLKEIGEIMGVTESRVCQLHSQAIARLRAATQVGEAALVPKKRGRPPKAR